MLQAGRITVGCNRQLTPGTFCGVFRRQALDRGSVLLGANKLCTGHNADDCAETILMNLQRGDTARLGRTTDLMTGRNESSLPRCKPLTYVYEKEVVLYAHFNRIPFFSTECSYAPGAYRGTTRSLVKDLESVDPRTILGIIHSGAHLVPVMEAGRRTLGKCSRCGYMTSGEVCKACILLEGLRQGRGQESARKGLLSKAS
ncbi:MAG: hypothetical protein KVP17_002423 [Porospora cf. gigantea B]|uniref:uncharacterized protein n=1 Tax=Porospora cf. gigantea B TaxID=2853592 RepID=UPI0035719299|nr:MAG: hypothetical protein KVP17_002423 [Porospora cf. gigantea B]